MNRRSLLAAPALALASIVCVPHAVPAGAQAGPPAAASRAPAVEWIGPDSRIRERRVERVRTREAWESLWHEHTGEGRKFRDETYAFAPRIDFSRFEVVAFFRGPARNNDGEHVVSIEEREDGLLIRFDSSTYQTFFAHDAPDTRTREHPFGIWVIDRTDGPIVVEENVQRLKDNPARWAEQRRFDAPIDE
ncbi:MAG: hypothetical protein KIS87_10850 [Phycisphaeraceae bacterium]|nr:hypothetical protein [Phycisphaeraceae bacterium]